MTELKDICDVHLHDEVKVNRIQEEMSQVNLSSMSKLFKVIGDENRAKIAYALCKDEELCVCDLANIIGASMATTSHHLRTLYKHAIVKYRKEGKLAFYSLDDHHIKQLILIALEHQQEVRVDG
ncbi:MULTISPECIES: metalloregulator ArsR/SmtB family transcription factor [Bacillaceae]|jgi:DNA-binding transcriptional ArsR family regulator|uniref:Cadmium resistance transcriptional regulatory protein CadC n=1 Tax=Peribacillus simplex TaxID=1478 RepID=A0A9W4L4M8_9BACI|nr:MULTISPECIES: metalloregulator ArsR/SmtB family transcription factor [Bacillaceae]MDR4928543.1 metalloregulator ArsR/SmtB family transcription factor [Peribacillus simplex]PEZ80880.1 transcriptional regulator [Bacillus sp. AFS017274]WHX91549.1 metalloregulator ArsR/SmtB family transcription factor [Peribacillus simplex]CAH0279679.1 Cadmium resistance transcriptional regulatory protein CadC [Peribacillus simplex]